MHKKNKNYWTFMLKCTNIELTVKRNKKQEGNKRMKGNVIVGQSGGPTAAINASLAGVYRTAKDRGANKVYGMLHGIQGLLKEKYIDLSDHIKTELDAELLKRTPAAFLGSCRYKLPEIHENREVYDKIFEILDKLDIEVFIYIGGNDSMDTVDKLSKYLNDKGITDITVVGAPKTIDNDLCGTDHCPGFGSAAKYIGTTFAELERDCHVYTTKAVTIVEVMGRDAGWLTAASCLARANGAKGPDFIYLCEVPFSIDTFLKDVKAKLEEQDAVIIAVSEGVKNKDGRYISEEVQSSAVDSFGHSYIAGAAKVLEDAVRNEIGCKVRSIELNLMQRCAAHLASATDIQESRILGKAACQYALEGAGGMMAAVIRTSDKPYATEFKALPVCDIANAIKSVPADYINDAGNDVTEKMVDYLTPLIQGEMNTVYENGIPKYIYLY